MKIAAILRETITNLFKGFITNETIVALLVSVSMIIFWIILAYIVTKIIKILVVKTSKFNKQSEKETKEQLTIRRLINNIIRSIFVFWIVVMILGELGLDLMPVLAGAGVLAFAIGFGAQELIKDLISGFFLIVEKTFRIGDFVTINGQEGIIADIGLRRTRIDNWRGQVITINNGDIKTVINHSLMESLAVIEFNVDPKFDVNIFYTEKFDTFLSDFMIKYDEILEMPSLPVILEITPDIKLRITIKTLNRKHARIEREFRKELLNYFEKEGLTLEIPVLLKDFN